MLWEGGKDKKRGYKGKKLSDDRIEFPFYFMEGCVKLTFNAACAKELRRAGTIIAVDEIRARATIQAGGRCAFVDVCQVKQVDEGN